MVHVLMRVFEASVHAASGGEVPTAATVSNHAGPPKHACPSLFLVPIPS